MGPPLNVKREVKKKEKGDRSQRTELETGPKILKNHRKFGKKSKFTEKRGSRACQEERKLKKKRQEEKKRVDF